MPRAEVAPRGRKRRASFVLAAGVLGLTLGVPSLLAQDTDEALLASAATVAPMAHRSRRAAPVVTRPDPEAPLDVVTAADGGPADPTFAPAERNYDALRAALPGALQSLAPVVLADHVPLAWWSEVTDTWLLEPARQRRRMPRRCRTRGGYREHCSGPRIVPEPDATAAAIASYFGLGERGTAMVMMHRESFPEWLTMVEGLDDETQLTFPVPTGHMGRGFGFTRSGELRRRRHHGVDIGGAEGAPIVAARSGVVVYSDNAITGYGNMVMILHPGGEATFYAHCRATFVAAGEMVHRGQRIAEVGETGFAGGPHLHFELRRNGASRDPRRRFLRRDAIEAPAEDAVVDDDVSELP